MKLPTTRFQLFCSPRHTVSVTVQLFAMLALILVMPGAPAQKKKEQVTLHTDAVEVLEIKPGAEKCAKGDEGTSLRLKVKSASPVDVRLYVLMPGRRWTDKDFLARQPGAEISDYTCLKNARYQVQTRAAGSNTPWPKP